MHNFEVQCQTSTKVQGVNRNWLFFVGEISFKFLFSFLLKIISYNSSYSFREVLVPTAWVFQPNPPTPYLIYWLIATINDKSDLLSVPYLLSSQFKDLMQILTFSFHISSLLSFTAHQSVEMALQKKERLVIVEPLR